MRRCPVTCSAAWMFVAIAASAGLTAEVELRVRVAETGGASTVEYWSGPNRVARSPNGAPVGVTLRLPGTNAVPVSFSTCTRREGEIILGPAKVGSLKLELHLVQKGPSLVERVLEVKADTAQRFAVTFPLEVVGEGEFASFSGPAKALTLYDTVRGSAKVETFPVAMVRTSDRVIGLVADSPGLWENRCQVLVDPEAHQLALLTGDGRDPYPLIVKPPEDARDTYQYQMDGWQSLGAGETRRFTTWAFASPARSHYDAQVAAHLAVANGKGWNSSLVEAVLRCQVARKDGWLCLDGGHEARNQALAPLLGYTELRTDLPGGRHANVRTMRAVVVHVDGSGRRLLAEPLAQEPDTWTQFAGWSPDGKQAVISRGWNDPENGRWEEEHKTFRMEPGKWLLDSYLLDLKTGALVNLTAKERVSHYNGGLFFLPNGRGLGFTPLINGVSKPFVMDLDGRNKRDVSGKEAGFAYGYSASPDGALISYHQDYQVYIAHADGTAKQRLETGHPFNFGPCWSAEGGWLMFLSGVRGASHPYVVRRDGTGLRKLADLNGYQGWVLFLDVEDFHEGSSDVPVWSADGKTVFYTAQVGKNVELFQVTLHGQPEPLTHSPAGTLHYHPQPSPDGRWLAYGSIRDGVRQLYVMRLADRAERQLTRLQRGQAAMWPHWQPTPNPIR